MQSPRKQPPLARGFETMASGFPASPITSNLFAALKSAVTDYGTSLSSIERINADKTLTDGAKLVRQATFVRAKMGAALQKLETARGQTREGLIANEKQLAE